MCWMWNLGGGHITYALLFYSKLSSCCFNSDWDLPSSYLSALPPHKHITITRHCRYLSQTQNRPISRWATVPSVWSLYMPMIRGTCSRSRVVCFRRSVEGRTTVWRPAIIYSTRIVLKSGLRSRTSALSVAGRCLPYSPFPHPIGLLFYSHTSLYFNTLAGPSLLHLNYVL